MTEQKSLAELMKQGLPPQGGVSREHMEKAARTYLDSYPEMDIATRAALFAEDARFEDPVGATPLVGKAAIVKFFEAGRDGGWSVVHKLQRIVISGQEAMLNFVTTLGMPGFEPAEVEVFENLAFNDEGKICALRAFFDASCFDSEMVKIARNRRTALAFFRALNASDTKAIVDAYTDDGGVTTMGNTLISGHFTKAQVQAAASSVLDAFPNGIRFEIRNMTAQGDLVSIEAEGFAIHASGKPYNNQYHFLMRCRGDKVVEFKEYMDTELVTDVLCGGQRRPAA